MDDDVAFVLVVGAILGMLITAAVWFSISHSVERDKVRDGYLTFDGRIYSVKLAKDLVKDREEAINKLKGDSK